MLIPRFVAFGKDKKAIVTCCASARKAENMFLSLPSEHYDFIDFDVAGLTQCEIETAVGV
jgi:hypothetical protein